MEIRVQSGLEHGVGKMAAFDIQYFPSLPLHAIITSCQLDEDTHMMIIKLLRCIKTNKEYSDLEFPPCSEKVAFYLYYINY